MKIYRENWVTDWLTDNSLFTSDIGEALSQPIKIAMIPMYSEFDHTPFDLVLITDIEFSHIVPVKQWIEQSKFKNYLVSLGGLEGYTVNEKDFIYRPWWMFNLMNKNQYQDTNHSNKTLDFDVLLGSKKPHRDFVMAKMQQSGLIDKSIVNYRSQFTAPVTTDTKLEKHIATILGDDNLNYPYISPNLKVDWEVAEEVQYSDSDKVPWGIFNQTKYSIITETKYNAFFCTEKTSKALLAKRLFVVFSCYQFLKNLKLMGFKTFDSVIDESYDEERDPCKRFDLAFEQVELLSKLDYVDVYQKIQPILEHNHNRMFEFRQEINDQMKNMVYNKIKEITC